MSQELNLTQEQIDNMSQKDWDNLPIVTGPKPGNKPGTAYLNPEDKSPDSPNLRDDLPKMEAEMSLPNKAIKITKGVLSLIRPNTAMLPQKEGHLTSRGKEEGKLPVQTADTTTTTVPKNTFDFDEYMRTKAEQARQTKKKYADVMFKGSGEPIISSDKPWRLIASNKYNQPYGAGNVMDHLVEIGKNVLIPGRFAKKLKRAYDYHKHTQQPPY